jgi:predicted nuclease with TOPRIM domain
MKGARILMKNSMVLGLSLMLIFGVLFMTSCGGKQEEAAQEGEETTEQARIEELQRELNSKNDIIKQLQRENADLQSKVPVSLEVQEGDNHWEIAHNYLTETKGLSEDEANKVLKNSYLYDSLLAGFQVGNISDSGEYSSFLSQGNAVASPGKMKRVEDTKKVAEKVVLRNNVTLAEIEGMRQNAEFKDKMMMVKKEMEALQNENAVLEENLDKYRVATDELDSRLNSVYYFTGTKDSLKATGKSDLGRVSYQDFQNRVDLREENTIELSAGDFNVPLIKKVEIEPKTLVVNVDYRITIASDGQTATVQLLKTDKFRLARIIIIVS